MSKMRKLLAILLTCAMVLGMSITTFAATAPAASDKAPAVVEGVESNASVTAYQIVRGQYNANGLYGYEKADNVEEGIVLDIDNPKAPTYAEVMAIAADINDGELELVSKSFEEQSNGTYTAALGTGYWIVLVRGTGSTIYNPMLMGVYYVIDEETEDNELFAEKVSATDSWTLEAQKTVAKSSTTKIEKDADVETQNSGKVVNYTVDTKVPDYSAEYTNVTFKVSDTLTNLTLNKNSIKVYAAKKDEVNENTEPLGENAYELENLSDTTFTVKFKNEWILKNVNEDITITYSATLDQAAINAVPGENKVVLEYSNNPNDTKAHDEDEEKVYSFQLDVLNKVDEDDNSLPGATFTVYTDAECKNVYTNSQFDGSVVSTDKGDLIVNGLAEGTYYVKETNAPAGYSLNTTVYTIVIDATIENEELISWTVTTTYVENNETKTVVNTYTVNKTTTDGKTDVTVTREGNDILVKNTSLVELPSTGGIGTTMFTIGGCGIMIAAAYLFFASRRKEEA